MPSPCHSLCLHFEYDSSDPVHALLGDFSQSAKKLFKQDWLIIKSYNITLFPIPDGWSI